MVGVWARSLRFPAVTERDCIDDDVLLVRLEIIILIIIKVTAQSARRSSVSRVQRDLDTSTQVPAQLDSFCRSNDVMEGGTDMFDNLRWDRVTRCSGHRHLLILLQRHHRVPDHKRNRLRARHSG